MRNIKAARRSVLITIIAILILTVLEFPAPIGFETRSQADVSLFWLVFFLIILLVEIAAIPVIYKWEKAGGFLGTSAAILNILQVIADQTHMMQPEAAPLGYLILEDFVFAASIVLAYFSWVTIKIAKQNN